MQRDTGKIPPAGSTLFLLDQPLGLEGCEPVADRSLNPSEDVGQVEPANPECGMAVPGLDSTEEGGKGDTFGCGELDGEILIHRAGDGSLYARRQISARVHQGGGCHRTPFESKRLTTPLALGIMPRTYSA